MNGQPIVKTYICLYELRIRRIGVYPLSAGDAQTLDGVFDGLPVELSMNARSWPACRQSCGRVLKSGRGSRFNDPIGSMNGASTVLFLYPISRAGGTRCERLHDSLKRALSRGVWFGCWLPWCLSWRSCWLIPSAASLTHRKEISNLAWRAATPIRRENKHPPSSTRGSVIALLLHKACGH